MGQEIKLKILKEIIRDLERQDAESIRPKPREEEPPVEEQAEECPPELMKPEGEDMSEDDARIMEEVLREHEDEKNKA